MSDDVSPATSNVQSQFSLLHLFVVISLVALLCAPAAYVGWPGLIGAGAFFAAAVGYALLSPKLKLVEILIVFGVVVGLIVLLLPVVDAPRVPSYRNWCMNNLSQLALAMHLYHDEHGSLPPAYIADASGTPLHSWRVLLLPYLEERKKFAAYRWDEPWNGPNNSLLADCPEIFHCPGDKAVDGTALTSYVVVTGPGTLFSDDGTTTFDQIRDGLSKTMMIVEVANSGIHWMEPRDLNVQQMATRINPPQGQGISSTHTGGAVIAFADKHVGFVAETISAKDIQAMSTIAVVEVVSSLPD